MSAQLTPQLDPRFAGWGTRIATGLIADKGVRKVYKVANPLLKQSLLDNINRKAVPVYAHSRNIDNVPGIVRRTMAWESGLKDGIFNYDIWKSKQLYGQSYRSRKTAEVIATPFERGVDFEKYRDNIAMPAFKAEWKPILKKLDIKESNLELHHIMAVKLLLVYMMDFNTEVKNGTM